MSSRCGSALINPGAARRFVIRLEHNGFSAVTFVDSDSGVAIVDAVVTHASPERFPKVSWPQPDSLD
jgi:hypothetical protein